MLIKCRANASKGWGGMRVGVGVVRVNANQVLSKYIKTKKGETLDGECWLVVGRGRGVGVV